MGDEGGGEVQAKKKGKKVKSQVEEEEAEDDEELQRKRDAEDAERLKRIEELRKRQSQLVNSLNQLQIATKPDPSNLKEGAEPNNKGKCSKFFIYSRLLVKNLPLYRTPFSACPAKFACKVIFCLESGKLLR